MYTILVLCLWCLHGVFCGNILYVSPLPSPSHYIWNRALAYGLVDKGHNVTLVAPDQNESTKPKNYTHIYMEGIYEALYSTSDDSPNDMASYSAFQMMTAMEEFCGIICQFTLNNEQFQQILNYPEDFFDLIIFDVTGGSCLYPLIHKFQYPPAIAVTPFLLPSYVAYNFGNQLNPSYVPWHSLPYSPDMTLMEKVWNYLFSYGEAALRHTRQYRAEGEIAKQTFGDDIPSMAELERKISLVLVNTDPVLELPQPLAPNFIPVGGLHTRKSKQLPQDLQDILDGATNGAIIFSLGSNVRSDMLDKKVQKEILAAFGKISQMVIWKFESDIEDLPKNVIVRKWLPQNDLLGHPNVKLFIGHGGALSTQEAMFHAVPMICVPFFMDQHLNTKKVVDRKLGAYLDFDKISSEYILATLEEVLTNPVYAENMKMVSRRFKDRAETPLERGVFWAEYAMRHGGADFLNTPARDLPFYQSSGLDIVGLLGLLLGVIPVLLYKIIRVIVKLSTPQKKVKRA